MKKIDLGQTVGILANVGVIAGIVFLAIEIHQNTRSLEVNAYQELIGQINEFATMTIERPGLNSLALSGSSSADLTDVEFAALRTYLYLITRHGDLAYYQYERGMLSEDRLESSLAPLIDRLCGALFREFWARNSYNFVPSYREYLDLRVSQC